MDETSTVVVETKPKLQTDGNVLTLLALAAGLLSIGGQAMSIFSPVLKSLWSLTNITWHGLHLPSLLQSSALPFGVIYRIDIREKVLFLALDCGAFGPFCGLCTYEQCC